MTATPLQRQALKAKDQYGYVVDPAHVAGFLRWNLAWSWNVPEAPIVRPGINSGPEHLHHSEGARNAIEESLREAHGLPRV